MHMTDAMDEISLIIRAIERLPLLVLLGVLLVAGLIVREFS